jgi:hypothetical protein
MQIQRIHLQNFQSIKGPVRLDLAPITMLYGPNSAGKSAVADAVRLIGNLKNVTSEQLVHEVHMRNPETPMAVGLGGWLGNPEAAGKEFINVDFLNPSSYFMHLGLRRYVDLQFHEEFNPVGAFSHRVIGEIMQDGDPAPARGARFPMPEFDVVFHFAGNKENSGANDYLLDGVTVALGGEWLAKVQHRGWTVSVNRRHHKLARNGSLHSFFKSFVTEARRVSKLIRTRRGKALVDVSRDAVTIKGIFVPLEAGFLRDSFVYEGLEALGLDVAFGKNAIDSMAADEAEMDEIYRDLEEKVWRYSNHQLAVLNEWLVGMIKVPAEMAVASARRLLAIGPLRDIPSSSDLALVSSAASREAVSLEPAQSGWSAGRAAWIAAPELDVSLVNEWLSASHRLDMPYEVRCVERRIATRNENKDPYPSGYPEESTRYFSVFLWDRILNQPVVPGDVGTGVSQVIPVLLAAISPHENLFIEQPELHLHPRLQGAVMDYLIAASRKGAITIVETHSEHLALRALRRCRETGRADIRHRDFSLTPDELALYYFEPRGGCTTVHRIRVDRNGRFLDRWPEGFFDERGEDLFDASH